MMGGLINKLKQLFPGTNPYETTGVERAVIFRQPYGYYKIYDEGAEYKIQSYDYGAINYNQEVRVRRERLIEYFRALKNNR